MSRTTAIPPRRPLRASFSASASEAARAAHDVPDGCFALWQVARTALTLFVPRTRAGGTTSSRLSFARRAARIAFASCFAVSFVGSSTIALTPACRIPRQVGRTYERRAVPVDLDAPELGCLRNSGHTRKRLRSPAIDLRARGSRRKPDRNDGRKCAEPQQTR